MTKLEQLHLFLKFHFAPDSEAKRQIWDDCCEVAYTDEAVIATCESILNNTYALSSDEIMMLNIVANPPTFANNDVDLAMKLTSALTNYDDDPEAAHATADEFLVNLVETLGHPSVAQAYRAVDKRC